MQKIRALIEVDPARAKEAIRQAFRKAKASRADAAAELGAGRAAFARWVERLGMGPELERLEAKAKKEGWHHGRYSLGGRPPKEA